MNMILQDLSAPALATAIEANLFSFFQLLSRWPRLESHDEPELLWMISDVPSPLFNPVLRARLTPDNVDAAIEAITARYQARRAPALWWTGPLTRPSDLGARLTEHGYMAAGDMPGMAADLEQLPAEAPPPAGLTIERVTDLASARDWSDTMAVGFGLPGVVNEALYDVVSTLGLEPDLPMVNYLGRVDGRAVATSSVFYGGGVAGIYNVTTLPEARRKGIGAAITLQPLRDARALGYRAAALQASDMGAGIYRRIGFEEYCRIGQYVWPDAGEGEDHA